MSANQQLYEAYRSLGSNPPQDPNGARVQFDLLNTERKCRDMQDDKEGITEAEKRAGMRAALRQFQRKCAGCNEVPKSLEPLNCAVCGKFKINFLGNIKEVKKHD